MIAYAAATSPSGWLNCDGSAVSRTTYADLFAVTSTTYGVGDGTTTFNLPDLRGRIPVGLDNIGGTDAGRLSVANTLGGTGGTETHTLTSAEMPVHTHTQTSHNHTQDTHNHTQTSHNHTQNAHAHSTGEAISGAGLIAFASGSQGFTTSTGNQTAVNQATTAVNQTTVATNQATTAVNQNTGSGGSHNNMQPYVLTYYIIKT
jgi:microcystin-dependent protein